MTNPDYDQMPAFEVAPDVGHGPAGDHGHADDNAGADHTGEASTPTKRATRLAVGGAIIAGEQIRLAGDRTVAVVMGMVAMTRDQANQRRDGAQSKLKAALDEAERRGRERMSGRKNVATSIIDGTVGGAVGWAQVNVVPQIVDDLVPHLISDVVPRLIDGALPEIKARVIPALIDDLTNDPRVRELILAQSRGVLGQVTEQLRTGTARADDRFEATAHRVFGRNDKSPGTGKGVNEARGA